MFQILEPTNAVFQLSKKIVELAQKQKIITNKMIKRMRSTFADEAFAELATYEAAKTAIPKKSPDSKENMAALNQRRIRFLNKFQMMTSNSKYASIVAQSLADPGKFFSCSYGNWPVCIFDFTFKSVLPEYFVYRLRPGTQVILVEDYFSITKHEVDFAFDDCPSGKEEVKEIQGPPNQIEEEDVAGGLLVERNLHMC